MSWTRKGKEELRESAFLLLTSTVLISSESPLPFQEGFPSDAHPISSSSIPYPLAAPSPSSTC